ncbi:MAG: hypothetical protein ABIN74_09805 [Ferruginibacter sp.]
MIHSWVAYAVVANGHGFVQVGYFISVRPELKHKSVTDDEDNK